MSMAPFRYHRPATIADVRHVADHLRADDARAIETATGKVPRDVLTAAFEAFGAEAITAPDGEVVGICGVSTPPGIEPGVGVVWMCGTDRVSRYAKVFMREAPPWIAGHLTSFPVLGNHVDLRNKLHVRWIGLLGFRFVHVHDVNGHPFGVFEMRTRLASATGSIH